MVIEFNQTAKPQTVEIMKARFVVPSWFLSILNQFPFEGPGHWIQGRVPQRPDTSFRIYGPDALEEGVEVYGTLSIHQSPRGRQDKRIILVPVSAAHKHFPDAMQMKAIQFAYCAAVFADSCEEWKNEYLLPNLEDENDAEVTPYLRAWFDMAGIAPAEPPAPARYGGRGGRGRGREDNPGLNDEYSAIANETNEEETN